VPKPQRAAPPRELERAPAGAAEFVICDHTIELIFRYLKHTMHGVHMITQHPIGIQNLFYALLLTALLHLHLKQRCLAEEGHNPLDILSTLPQQPDEHIVQISDDEDRPANHLAIARFFARLNDALTRFLEDIKALVAYSG